MTKTAKALVAMAVATAITGAAGAALARDHGGPGLEERFQQMDANRDGKVTADELRDHRDARFAAADTNGDGKLSLIEIDASRAEHRQKRIARLISWQDRDGDGMLSADEVPEMGATKLMRADRDSDGAVSLEEMRQALRHHKRGSPQ